MKTAIRPVNALHQNPGQLDSKELSLASELTIAARKQGVAVDRVRMGFAGNDPRVVDKFGEEWIRAEDGTFYNLKDLDALPDSDLDWNAYES